jgi:anti-anti-sigma factor
MGTGQLGELGNGPLHHIVISEACISDALCAVGVTTHFDAAVEAGIGDLESVMTLEHPQEGESLEILAIGTRHDRDEFIIELGGEFDLSGVTAVSEAFAAAFDSDARAIVLDLRALEFLDSTGVHAVLKAARRATEQNRSFVVIRGPRQVQRIFEISGIAEMLAFSDGSRARD